MSGREHSVRRALVAPAFRGRTLDEQFLPVIERNARQLIDGFRADGSADVASDFAARFPVYVIADMPGLDKGDFEKFHEWYTSIIAFLGNLSQDAAVTAAGPRTRQEFAEYMIPIIQERRANPGDDLLSNLVSAEVEGTRMSDEDVKAIVSIVKNLLDHPDQLAAVREDRGLIARAFAETLRFNPPVHMIMRQPAEDVRVSGGTIPAGRTVTCLIGAANRDELRYRDPDSFDIFRADLAAATAFSAAADHLAFALGRHFCVGALLAKAEVEVGVGQLLDAMPDLRLRSGYIPYEQGVFTRAPAALPVEFTPVG